MLRVRRKKYDISASPLFKIWTKKRLEKVLGFSRRELSIAADPRNYRCFTTDSNRRCEQPLGLTEKVHIKIAKLLSRIEVPDYVKSQKGESYVGNAREHIGNVPSVRTDVAKFYPSTTCQRVWEFFRFKAKCSEDVATQLAAICTYEEHLPTGSPISGYLAYFANYQTFDELHGLAKSSGCVMTCYVDDIIFSGEGANAELLERVVKVIRKSGLRHNRKKSSVLVRGLPKRITGVIVTPTEIRVPNSRQKAIGELFYRMQAGDATCRSSLIGRLWEAAQIDVKFKRKVETVRLKKEKLKVSGRIPL